MVNKTTARVLARCNGFRVTAEGEVVGDVATPVFSGTKLLPEYLLVRVADGVLARSRSRRRSSARTRETSSAIENGFVT